MSCHDMASNLTAHAQGELAGAEREALERHLSQCKACRREFEETCRLLSLAGELPRMAATPSFHQRLMEAVHVEREVIRMSGGDRFRMAIGYMGYKIRQSRKARVLMYAMAAQVAVLITMVVSFGLIVQTTEVPRPQMIVEPGVEQESSDPGADQGLKFPDEESGRLSLPGERSFDPPHRIFSDLAADPVPDPIAGHVDPVANLSLEELDRMVERENRMELSRFRMEARFAWKNKDHVRTGRGGDLRTVKAVDRGLEGLQRIQDGQGSWSSAGSEVGDPRMVAGVSALAVAAFLSDGHTQEKGRYREAVRKGLGFLIAASDAKGRIGFIERDPLASLFNQSAAVLALAENFILCQGANEEELLAGIDALCTLVLNFQEQDGRWAENACSHTWAAMALKTSLMTGLKRPRLDEAARTAAERVAHQARLEGWALVPSTTTKQMPPIYAASGMAIHALFFDEPFQRDPDWLPLPDSNQPDKLLSLLDEPLFREPSFLFFLGTALCEQGHPLWEAWNRDIKILLTKEQGENGLWAAEGEWPWIRGGNVYTTALNLLTLQVYYRFSKLEQESH